MKVEPTVGRSGRMRHRALRTMSLICFRLGVGLLANPLLVMRLRGCGTNLRIGGAWGKTGLTVLMGGMERMELMVGMEGMGQTATMASMAILETMAKMVGMVETERMASMATTEGMAGMETQAETEGMAAMGWTEPMAPKARHRQLLRE